MDIVTQPQIMLLGISVKAPWDALWLQMPQAWQQLFGRLWEIDQDPDPILVDASLQCQKGLYQQLVSCQVTASAAVPTGMAAVCIPPASYIHYTHSGPATAIADSFAAMLNWARAQHMPVSDLKLDFGYSQGADEPAHELYIALQPTPEWRWV
ncbi:GyrI-like domain-containing protein [Bowmanella denitrificans]|uniref:GyrI-like domain-containing protein n=1 Tax=Bowmanella denitrificans TaxID=366582 RepID=UPI001558E848|nr:effector binding domain-containing protein [Bowmanella denitrificans]